MSWGWLFKKFVNAAFDDNDNLWFFGSNRSQAVTCPDLLECFTSTTANGAARRIRDYSRAGLFNHEWTRIDANKGIPFVFIGVYSWFIIVFMDCCVARLHLSHPDNVDRSCGYVVPRVAGRAHTVGAPCSFDRSRFKPMCRAGPVRDESDLG
jgi:hypothetical protein